MLSNNYLKKLYKFNKLITITNKPWIISLCFHNKIFKDFHKKYLTNMIFYNNSYYKILNNNDIIKYKKNLDYDKIIIYNKNIIQLEIFKLLYFKISNIDLINLILNQYQKIIIKKKILVIHDKNNHLNWKTIIKDYINCKKIIKSNINNIQTTVITCL